METKKIKFRPDRLLKLAQHLETGKLGHKKFNFLVVSEGPRDSKGCGTIGCAIGECPIVFPRRWKFDRAGNPRLVSIFSISSFDDVATDFGITYDEATSLFAPHKPRPWAKSGKRLFYDATKQQVAQSIRQFVTWKLKQIKAGAQ